MNQPNVSIPIIGYHRSALTQKFGIPRQPNLVEVPSRIELIAPYDSAEAFEGIESFSHLWITWHTHHNYLSKTQQVDADDVNNSSKATDQFARFKPKVRPPRLGGNSKLGVFATRSTYRPSQLGLSVVKLIDVELKGSSVILHISGADMVDGTPIIDIKPYIAYSDAVTEAVSGFAVDKPALKPVNMSEAAQQQLNLELTQSAKTQSTTAESAWTPTAEPQSAQLTIQDVDIICQLIAQDPRPAYRQQQSDRVFYMRYKNYDIGFQTQSSGIDYQQSVSPSSKAVAEGLLIVSITAIN